MRRWFLRDEAQTERLGEVLGGFVEPGEAVGLIGELGAGKTCLSRGLMRGLYARFGGPLGDEARVTSPTYTLVNEYQGAGPFGRVAHFDLYRLKDMDDLESTGYWDQVTQADLALLEWLDRLPQAWPGEGFEVRLEHAPAGRVASVAWRGGAEGEGRAGALCAALDEALGASEGA